MNRLKYFVIPIILGLTYFIIKTALCNNEVKTSSIDFGWSQNSVNTVIFRNNAIVSDENYQFTAFYDTMKHVVLAKRKLKTEEWDITKTKFSGNANDAHNSISIAIDGDGFIHMSWDHHNTKLRYVKSKEPYKLEFGTEQKMTDINESSVSYPEFYNFPDGDLLFLYRNGESGRGNLEVNFYDLKSKKWSKRLSNLIDGENERSAYWQACIDRNGSIHLSWNWRETWDVATNHDLCYAKSDDKGITWEKSSGIKYNLPINADKAEYIASIPQNSNLINQTSITTDSNNQPLVSTYYSPYRGSVPQYVLFSLSNNIWKKEVISNRKLNFNLGGGGTKRIPISRPKLLVDFNDNLYLIFRDLEQNEKISVLKKLSGNAHWEFQNLTDYSVGAWEPNYDKNLWRKENILDLFVQKVGQGDGELLESVKPQIVSVLRWNP